MAYLDKEAYEAKKRYANRVHKENKENCKTLTEEQHDALSELCSIRHEVHCNKKAFFHCEDSNYKIYWDYIDDGCNGSTINKMLLNVGLPAINFGIDPLDYDCDYDFDECNDEYQDALYEVLNMAEKFNRTIEIYLEKIDETHKTKYAPTGGSRKWW